MLPTERSRVNWAENVSAIIITHTLEKPLGRHVSELKGRNFLPTRKLLKTKMSYLRDAEIAMDDQDNDNSGPDNSELRLDLLKKPNIAALTVADLLDDVEGKRRIKSKMIIFGFIVKFQQKILERGNKLKYLGLLSRTRADDGGVNTNIYPSADNAGIGWLEIFDSLEAGLTSDELTATTRAALVGLSIGIRLGRDRNLSGFPMEAGLRNYRLK